MRQRNVKNKEEIITSSKYFVNNPENYIGKWNTYFQNNNPIYIEIGMGKGDFIIGMAKQNPNALKMLDLQIGKKIRHTI